MQIKIMPQINAKLKIRSLLLAAFFMAVSMAQFAYVQSTYLNKFFNLEAVSVIFFCTYALTFILMNEYPNVIAKFNNIKSAIGVLILEMVSLLIFIFFHQPMVVLIAFLLYIICTNLIFINFDIFLESYTSDAQTGRIRGIYMTIYNLGWVISPYLSGRIIESLGFNWMFAFVLALLLPIILIFLLVFKDFKNHFHRKKFKIIKTISELRQHPNLEKIFYLAFLLQVFYAVMVIYVPIYLNQTIGLDWKQIGIIFSIMLLPFVIVQFPAGYLADKYWGEKEMLTLGLVITAITAALIFFINTPTIWVWALILFCSRVGASLIEIMRDTYFFKKVPVGKIEFINAFRSTMPLAYIFTPLIAGLLLIFLPLAYLFLALAVIMASGLYFALTLKDTN